MRQKLRVFFTTVSLIAFPVTMNYISPYVITVGAFQGLVTASVLSFIVLLATSPFFGRLFCSWICPAGAVQDILARSRTKPYGGGFRDTLKYLIWALWMGTIVYGFLMAGFQGTALLLLTETGISVDEPFKYLVYFSVIAVFFILALALGKRAACHSICWMAPFMVLGRKIGNALHVPAFRLVADTEKCTSCGTCRRRCPMSLDIAAMAKSGTTEHPECILCAECVDACPANALSLRFGRPLVSRGRRSSR